VTPPISSKAVIVVRSIAMVLQGLKDEGIPCTCERRFLRRFPITIKVVLRPYRSHQPHAILVSSLFVADKHGMGRCNRRGLTKKLKPAIEHARAQRARASEQSQQKVI
jgi:hypothetical protein